MAPALASDQVKGTNRADSEWVIEAIAKLHAKWWNSERLASFEWAQPIMNAVPMDQGLLMIKDAIEKSETTGAFDAYPEIKRLMKLLPPLFAMDPPPPFPYTLCHGDLRSDNVFCPTSNGGDYSLIDWQLSGISQPANDLARWFTQSITVEQRRETEIDLLKLYHQRLVEYGVTGYSFKRLKQDYQLNLVVLLIIFSNTMEDLDKSDERSKAVLHVMYARLDEALTDWKVINLLRVLPYMIPFLKLSVLIRSKLASLFAKSDK
jgi:thiamine kinase-like enzyme